MLSLHLPALTPCLCAAQHPWLRSQGIAADKPLDSVVLKRMRKLSATNKLKKAALVVMAKSLNPDEINGLQQLFRNIDADNSGTITIDELRTALTSCNGNMSVGAAACLSAPMHSRGAGGCVTGRAGRSLTSVQCETSVQACSSCLATVPGGRRHLA